MQANRLKCRVTNINYFINCFTYHHLFFKIFIPISRIISFNFRRQYFLEKRVKALLTVYRNSKNKVSTLYKLFNAETSSGFASSHVYNHSRNSPRISHVSLEVCRRRWRRCRTRTSANSETSDVPNNFRNSTVEYVPRHFRRVTFWP